MRWGVLAPRRRRLGLAILGIAALPFACASGGDDGAGSASALGDDAGVGADGASAQDASLDASAGEAGHDARADG
ncbi:MAG: hypothetical protein ACRELB_01405, partial [Polyangiaceae bacterium]